VWPKKRETVTLKIGAAVTGGIGRVANRNGLVLILAYIALGVVWQLSLYSAIVNALPAQVAAETALPTIGISTAVAIGGAGLSLVLLQLLTIVAIRTFVSGHSTAIPTEYYTRNILVVLVNSVLGGIVYGALVLIGSLLLVIPGIIAYVAFMFMMLFIAVEDENFIAALQDSWQLTRGNWLGLFGLLLIVGVGIGIVSGVLSVVSSLFVGAYVGEGAGTMVSGVLTLPFSLLTLGILAEAFNQLRADASGMSSL
jgi:hypothetical protein